MNQIFPFLFGVILGLCLSFFCVYPLKPINVVKKNYKFNEKNNDINSSSLYDEALSDKLFNEVRILCWIMTTPKNHKTKAQYIKKTWGQRCNKLLFISTKADPELETITLPVKEGRDTLWDKTKNAFLYIHKRHLNDADWFLKADDDNYMFIENIRYMLYQYHPQTSLYFGHRFAVTQIPEGYMAGGGYILSKKALQKFATEIKSNATVCSLSEDGNEDWEMGRCLQHSAIAADERDERFGKRFFPAGILEHLKPEKDLEYWYDNSQYYSVPQGSLECCSDTPVALHYVSPEEMYMMEYLTRRVHPFGLEKNLTEKLPRKLTLEEIIERSDVESSSQNFVQHQFYHAIEESEKYKRK